jgi:hypothetical protein
MKILTKIAQNYLDRHVRAPRGLGFSVDEGMPDRGRRYGGAQTLHNTGTIDVVLDENGRITEVWFRCQMLAFRVSKPKGHEAYRDDTGMHLVAIETAD